MLLQNSHVMSNAQGYQYGLISNYTKVFDYNYKAIIPFLQMYFRLFFKKNSSIKKEIKWNKKTRG